jgi:large subunit ribosomal protein L13
VLTSGKEGKKIAYRHSGYPGGLKQRSYTEMMSERPEEVVRKAVRGMLPKGPLGRSMLKKLKVYSGPTHPHAAQLPEPLALVGAVARERQ